MTNDDKLRATFAKALDLEPSLVVDGLEYNTIKQWDSVAHMGLVAALEDAFGIMLDTDDIVDLSSVGKARQILAKYHVTF